MKLAALCNLRAVNALLTVAHRLRRVLRFRPARRRLATETGEREHAVLRALRRDGIAIVPEFLAREQCAALRAEIDATLAARPAAVNTDAERCDHRLFALERISAAARRFHDDPWLHDLAQLYCGADVVNAFTMAGKLVCQPNNRGSGLGWHRDSFARQFKALVYLSDVSDQHGPFQLVRGSADLSYMVRAIWSERLGYLQNRLTDAQVAGIVARAPSRLVTVTGAAGTLVLANTSAIHRGMPIRTGTRYALTSYYYVRRELTAKVVAHLNRGVRLVDGKPLAVDDTKELRADRAAADRARDRRAGATPDVP